MNPLTTRLRRLLPHLTCAKRVCAQELAARPAFWPYIIKQRNFLKKKFQWPNKYTKCRVSDFLTRCYSTDRGIIETTLLKTSFSRSHFSLFLPIPIEQIPAFPRKEKRAYSSGEKAWRRRDEPALQAKITGLMIFTSRNVFSRFSFESFSQFFLSLRNDSLPFLYQQVLNSRFGDQVHENLATISKFGRQYQSTASQSDLVWFISFVSLQT